MVCRACGGTTFDAAGTCLGCGAKAEAAYGSTSGEIAVALAVDPDSPPMPAQAYFVAAAPNADETLVLPEPVAITQPKPATLPARSPSTPLTERDPAATNPGSGVFCGRCGSAVDAQGDYCGICGNPLKEAAMQRLRQSRGLGTKATAQAAPFGNPVRASAAPPETRPPMAATSAPHPARFLLILGLMAALIASVAVGVLVLHQH